MGSRHNSCFLYKLLFLQQYVSPSLCVDKHGLSKLGHNFQEKTET